MNRCNELISISESYRLIYESISLSKDKVYRCGDIFKGSDPTKHHFYYVKAGYDIKKYKGIFSKYKQLSKPQFFEAYGFENLTNPKMEYHFNYLFRIQGSQTIMQLIFADFTYDYGIDRVGFTKREIFVPEGNDEALDDEMKCDFFLPGIAMKPETRKHFGDIMDVL